MAEDYSRYILSVTFFYTSRFPRRRDQDSRRRDHGISGFRNLGIVCGAKKIERFQPFALQTASKPNKKLDFSKNIRSMRPPFGV